MIIAVPQNSIAQKTRQQKLARIGVTLGSSQLCSTACILYSALHTDLAYHYCNYTIAIMHLSI
jgi:hypothetical protein